MGLMKEYKPIGVNRKIHIIAKSSKNPNKDQIVYGITIPPKIAKNYKKTFFSIIPEGDNILLKSGCEVHL